MYNVCMYVCRYTQNLKAMTISPVKTGNACSHAFRLRGPTSRFERPAGIYINHLRTKEATMNVADEMARSYMNR